MPIERKPDSIINSIAAAIAQFPGRTGAELGQLLGKPGAYRRLSEISRLGLAKKGSRRYCAVSRKMADTWFADDRPAEPDRGNLTPHQNIKRLQDRISYLEADNARLQAKLDALVNEKDNEDLPADCDY